MISSAPGFEGRGHLRDHLDVVSDHLLLFLDFVQAPVDASGQAAELLLCEPPFFASKFRWIDSRTSWRAVGHPQAREDAAVPPDHH